MTVFGGRGWDLFSGDVMHMSQRQSEMEMSTQVLQKGKKT